MTHAYPIAHVVGRESEALPVLKALRIRQSVGFLDRAKSPRQRKALSEATGIKESAILDFANAADLMRIKGIGRDYVALLRAAEVPTVRELRNRNPHNLFMAMSRANAAQRMVEFLPPEKHVGRWIEQAKALPILISYKDGARL